MLFCLPAAANSFPVNSDLKIHVIEHTCQSDNYLFYFIVLKLYYTFSYSIVYVQYFSIQYFGMTIVMFIGCYMTDGNNAKK